MKKKLLSLIAVSTLLIACGNEEENNPQEENNETEVKNTNTTDDNEIVPKEKKETAKESKELVLNEPLDIGDYTITITDFSLAKDYEDNDALVVTYDWINNSEKNTSAFITFTLKGYQDNVETDNVLLVEDTNLAAGQKDVKPGGEVKGAQTIVGIENIDQPLELELDVFISLESSPYTTTLDLQKLK